MVRLPFLPREDKFFDLFEQGARNTVRVAEKLRDLAYNWKDIEKNVDDIAELEHEGDRITHQVMRQLHRTFVTPFDREDIALLSHTIDDVTDLLHAAADTMLLYQVDKPSDRVKELCDLVVQASVEIEKGMPLLRRRAQMKQILKNCVEINRIENVADSVARAALAELFQNTGDTVKIIKWREIYDYLESATDRCEDVANVLEGVALKHA